MIGTQVERRYLAAILVGQFNTHCQRAAFVANEGKQEPERHRLNDVRTPTNITLSHFPKLNSTTSDLEEGSILATFLQLPVP